MAPAFQGRDVENCSNHPATVFFCSLSQKISFFFGAGWRGVRIWPVLHCSAFVSDWLEENAGQPAQPAVDAGRLNRYSQGRHWPPALEVAEPVGVPGSWGLWHPCAGMFEDLKESELELQPRRPQREGQAGPVIGLCCSACHIRHRR